MIRWGLPILVFLKSTFERVPTLVWILSFSLKAALESYGFKLTELSLFAFVLFVFALLNFALFTFTPLSF